LRPETSASGSALFVSQSSLRHSGIVFCDVGHTSAQTTKLKEGHSRSRINIMTSPSLLLGLQSGAKSVQDSWSTWRPFLASYLTAPSYNPAIHTCTVVRFTDLSGRLLATP